MAKNCSKSTEAELQINLILAYSKLTNKKKTALVPKMNS